MRTAHVVGLVVALASTVALTGAGCGSSVNRNGGFTDDAGSSGTSGGFGEAGDGPRACVGLECQQKNCGGGDTTVTGTVFAPNGKLPLYNAIVYVPNTEPDALTHGATCDKCGAVTGSPVVTTLSDSSGKFTLKNVPVGKNIPLVIQIGKWRRQVTIADVAECTETKLTDPELTRLPRKQSEGDMPRMALTTGGCDKLGCMLPKVGIDASEIGVETDGPSKALHVYNGTTSGAGAGGPGAANSARTFWNDATKLKAYDLVVLSCECSESPDSKGAPAYAAMTDYLSAGGRIFTTDFMYTWYRYSPDAQLASATSIRGGANEGGKPMTIDTSFPKGKALGDWLGTVTPGSNNQVTPDYVFSNIISTDPAKSQKWAASGPAGFGDPTSAGPRVFSVNVPVGVPAEMQCGKGVHIDAHVNDAASTDKIDATYPKGCASDLKEGEKLLAFFFFDLASCIQNDTEAPKPPQVK